MCLLLAVSEGNRWGWGSPEILGLFAAAAAVLAYWVRFEQRVAASRSWTSSCCACAPSGPRTSTGFLIGFGMFGSFILIPQFVQMPAAAGLRLRGRRHRAPACSCCRPPRSMLVAGPLAGTLAGRRGSKLPLLLGTAFAGLSFRCWRWRTRRSGRSSSRSRCSGSASGSSFASMANLIVEAVPQHQTGEATGMNTIMRTVGGAFGGQIAAAIVADHIDASTGLAAESGFTAAFVLGAVALGIAMVSATLIPGRRVAPVMSAARDPKPPSAKHADAACTREGFTSMRALRLLVSLVAACGAAELTLRFSGPG